MAANLEATTGGFERRLLREPVLAPRLTEVAGDPTRRDIVGQTSMTEQEAAAEAVGYLQGYVNIFGTAEHEASVLASLEDQVASEEISPVAPMYGEALNILDFGTMMGRHEFDTAVTAIAEDWAMYLAEDPERQILVVPGPALVTRYARQGRYKSDSYVLELVLQQVVHALGADSIGSRIVGDPRSLLAESGKRRVAVVEDAILSGRQLSETLDHFAVRHPELVNDLEIDLLVASRAMCDGGFMPLLETESDIIETPEEGLVHEFERPIPVFAPYVAHERTRPDTRGETFYAGYHLVDASHTVFDYGFAAELRQMNDNLFGALPEGTSNAQPYPVLAEAATFRDVYNSIDYTLSSRLWMGTEFDGLVFPRAQQ